ncbi:carboxypeptidase S [Mycena epipterygia]|nr:carboxypeptidase S [Mycena epipterygia]
MDLKYETELPGGSPTPRPRRVRWSIVVAGIALTAFIHFLLTSPAAGGPRRPCGMPESEASVCPQASPLIPEKNGALWAELTALHATDEFLMRAVRELSAAVRIPTETFDAMGPIGEDERWLTRGPFVEHLEKAFPLVHATLDLQKVNTYGLIYAWQGTDASLKPLLLMGHYDVVPVAPLSADQWTHPAYSGYFDGEILWGRGSADDKNGVIGILTSIESLLEKKFVPTRTVVLSFGFDEEAGGYHGAGHLGPALLERFGPDSMAMIVDEGSGYSDSYGAIFAAPAVTEKGSVNVAIEVQTPGGHSSVPPEHTSIGILAALIVHLEANAPKAVLEVGTPTFEMAQCFGAHGPAMPRALKAAILHAETDPEARKAAGELLLQDRIFKALVSTTLAVDIIGGGVKSNALPEQALATVNHRIATQSSVNATLSRDAALVMDLAARFNLSVTAYGEALTAPGAAALGSLSLRAPRTLEPAPLTPRDAPPFRLLAGSIRAAFQAARKGATDVVVAPGLMTGNTDTRFNWALSKHIFRYGHRNMLGGNMGGAHTVNENIRADSFVEMIAYFTALILNADEAEL